MKKEISFGRWLYNQRRALDLTRKAFAGQVGCAEVTLRRIENDTLKPSVELARILLEKLGVPENDHPEWIRFARGLTGYPEENFDFTDITRPLVSLPASLTSFIGRKLDQDQVINLVTKHRIVTLLGIGGIGKTSLSLQVGQKLLKDYPQGVWFISLDALTDPVLVPQTVAAVFQIRESNAHPSIELLTNKLRDKSSLLILDNCEHVLDACAQLCTTLLVNCPNVKILATSRELMGVKGEAAYQLPSLSIPKPDEESLETLAEYESIHLFTERASLALPSFALTKENAKTVADICRKVDGIPLAIELAAAYVNILQVTEILTQLQSSLALLSTNHRMNVSHHQTMQASLDWSWNQLSEAEKRFMRQLSVFGGGWTLESAQVVCGGDVLRLTSSLVKKSLIRVNQESERATRYLFHEIVHQYTCGKLLEAGEDAGVRSLHLNYFLELSELAEPALHGPQQMAWFNRINDERGNIRAALDQAFRTDLEAGLYLSGNLIRYWENADVHEGLSWITKFVQHPESNTYPHARAKGLLSRGILLWYLQQFNVARSIAEECIALFRTCADRQGEIDGLFLLGSALQYLEGMERKIEFHNQALSLAQSIGDMWRQAIALAALGWDGRDPQRSRTYREAAINLFRQEGDWRNIAFNLGILGYTVLLNGETDAAQTFLDESLEINRRMNYKRELEFVLTAKSHLALMRGECEQARVFLQQWLVIAEETGNRMGYLWAHARLGDVALCEGNMHEARYIFVDVIENFHKDQNKSGLSFVLDKAVGLFVMTNKPEYAVRLMGWSDIARKEIGEPRSSFEQADMDKDIASIIAQIGETAFSEAYEVGKKMTVDEVVAYALGKLNSLMQT
jgi:predicted ATPase/DNA-binding XRE family transcriptional regulator